MANAQRDANSVSTLLAVSNVDGITPVTLYADPTTHRLLTSGSGGGGSPGGSSGQMQWNNSGSFDGTSGLTTDGTNVNAIDANFFIIDNADTTKKVTFQVSGITTGTTRTVTFPDASGTATLLGNTSTGSGSIVLATSPSLVTPTLGAATYTTLSGGNITVTAANIITDTSTGMKIGTATTQKLGFFNATPIVQPTGDVITALQNLGLGASLTVTATTNANLTGPITSVGNATSIASQTGTGTKFVVDTSPTIITPTFTTNATTPLLIGGSGTTGTQLTLKTTTGNGTTDALVIAGGNNGGTTFATFSNNVSNFGTSSVTTTGTIELGAASDTTIARNSAGVISIEGEILNGYTTTATAAGTTTLTITATKTQFFTGSTTQTVKLPTTSVIVGQTYIINNQSTGNVTVQSSGANTIQILGAGMSATFTAIVATPTTAANWVCALEEYTALNNAATASSNAYTILLAYKTNTVTNNSASGLTITLPTAGAIDGEMRVVRILPSTAAAQTLTLVNTETNATGGATAPANTGSSTTIPITLGFQYNAGTSKWTILASG